MNKIRIINYMSTFILCILSTIISLTVENYYFNYAALAFIYSLITSIFFLIDESSMKLPVLIIRITSFVRYFIIPIIVIFQNSSEFIMDNNIIFIMIFELLASHITILLYYKRVKFINKKRRMDYQEKLAEEAICNNNYKNINSTKIIKISVSIIYIVGIVLLIRYPAIIKNYFSFSFTSKTYIGFNGLYSIIIDIFFFLLMVEMLIRVKRLIVLSVNTKLILSVIVCVIYTNGQSITSIVVSRWSLVTCIIVSIVFLLTLYPEKKKILITCTALVIPFILVYGTIVKHMLWQNGSEIGFYDAIVRSFSYNSINAYFSGPMNITTGLKMLQNNNLPNLKIILSDIFANFPFINHFVDPMYTTPGLYNYSYYGSYISKDQICPIIIQLYLYFGILSPIAYSLLVYLGLHSYSKIEHTNSFILKNIYIIVSIYCSLILCININIIFQVLWQQAFPLLLVDRLNFRVKVRN